MHTDVPDQDSNLRLEGQRTLVTGSSKGIGRAIAVAFAREGADVVINYPNKQEEDNANHAATQACDVAPDHLDNTVLTVEADVSKQNDVNGMFDRVERELGDVTALVNNAGVFSSSPITELSTDEWEKVMSVNLRGSFLTIRRALKSMLENKSGSIINVVSELAYIGDVNVSHYAASKGGVVSLTRSVAREAAPDVRVNAIAPGPISTDLLMQTPEDQLEKQLEIPAKRAGEPDEVAPTAVFLASEDASYYFGQVLSPSGGAIMT